MKTTKIGKVKLANRTVLAPLAGVNNATFRYFCHKYGCGLVYSYMLHVESLVHNEKDILAKLAAKKSDKPFTIQLVGNKPESFKKATKIIEPYADIVDINFGCPDKDIVRSKCGSYFLKYPAEMSKIINAVQSSTNKPVTVKTRLGFDKSELDKYMKIFNDCKVDAIAIHGRTAKQGYAGEVDYDEIKRAKQNTEIPIMANGNIDEKNCRDILDHTNADFLMIGRAAIGMPFLFELINNKLNGKKPDSLADNKIDRAELIKDFLKKYDELENVKDLNELKLHISWLLKGMVGVKRHRNEIMLCKSMEELNSMIKHIS